MYSSFDPIPILTNIITVVLFLLLFGFELIPKQQNHKLIYLLSPIWTFFIGIEARVVPDIAVSKAKSQLRH